MTGNITVAITGQPFAKVALIGQKIINVSVMQNYSLQCFVWKGEGVYVGASETEREKYGLYDVCHALILLTISMVL
jgi:hypothetical protein